MFMLAPKSDRDKARSTRRTEPSSSTRRRGSKVRALVSLKPHCGSQRFRASPRTCLRRIVPHAVPGHPRQSGFGAIREPFGLKALPPDSCLFVFALTKYEGGSA
jgi:hypothetical protein